MFANLGKMATEPAIASSPERDRYAAFLADQLLLAFAALAVAPIFLAGHGAPTPPESLLFAATLTPGAAALAVAGSGCLARGHAVAAAGLAAIGLVLFLALGAGAGAAIAWFVAAGLELPSIDRRVRRAAGLALGTVTSAVAAAAFDPRFAPSSPTVGALFSGIAAAVAALSLRRMCRATNMLQTALSDEAARAQALDAAQGRMILDLDADGLLRALARPAAGLVAVDDDTILGRGLFDRIHVADRPAFLTLVDDAAHGSDATIGRFRLRVDPGSGGTASFLLLEMRAHRLPGGTVIAVLEDVSDRSIQADELKTTRDAVAEALRGKDQFMTTMSHELRTPLNAIIGFSEILGSRTMRPQDVAKQYEFARIINQSGRHLLGVVNAVLDVSRLQSGAYPIRLEAFDAASLIKQSIEAVAGKARESAVALRSDAPPDLEDIVGDGRALKAALVALLENAVKFTPAGGAVALRVRPEGTALVVAVTDTGCGIAAEDLARLGQPFFQSGGSHGGAGGSHGGAGGDLARPFDGAGLGLVLVRGIVGLHGGSIGVESEIGRGTTVTLRLPLDCRAVTHRDAHLGIIAHRPRSTPIFAKEAA